MITRRKIIISGASIAAALAIGKPGDKGGSHTKYFQSINQLLKKNGVDKPTLVIDLERLNRNIDRVSQSVGQADEKTYRIVTKSLPSPQLVQYVQQRSGTKALMAFHRPFLESMANISPDSDILLGKPLPINAARTFYENHHGDFEPSRQLQWLIDTNDRLMQYKRLAEEIDTKMRINLEIDVGLRRGGFDAGEQLANALSIISENPEQFQFSGFMGYDAHLMSIPQLFVKRELNKVKQRYAACVNQLREDFNQLFCPELCFNGAGSPTFKYYENDQLVNDLSAGSCLLKPGDYDLPILDEFEASAFIASPVLKQLQGARLPTLEWAGSLLRGWNKNYEQTFFCYGGNWLAKPVSPPGLSSHFAYTSSNQQGYMASHSVDIDVDDFIFMRPSQSEAVLLQFGDLLVIKDNRIVDYWPVLKENSADENPFR